MCTVILLQYMYSKLHNWQPEYLTSTKKSEIMYTLVYLLDFIQLYFVFWQYIHCITNCLLQITKQWTINNQAHVP